jgi:acyl-CoA synthetase (AMP-forming)/AMP-acid ligase II
MSRIDTTQVGQRLIYHIIDERGRNNHPRPYAAIPRTPNISDGFQDISWQAFANAINRCATWMRELLGVTSTCQAVAYLGPLDLRYQIIAVAAGKIGYAVRNRHPKQLQALYLLTIFSDVLPVAAKLDGRFRVAHARS